MDRMTAMTVFVQVVEAESFSSAARRLGLPKSSVSMHVSRLEEWLGAQLLHRTTRRLALTEVGRAYYERCAQIVREVEEAELEAASSHAAPRGRLKGERPDEASRTYSSRRRSRTSSAAIPTSGWRRPSTTAP